jgi:hypothetical protein
MTSSADGSSDEIFDFDRPLSAEESLDDDELDVDPDEGYSPPERPLGVSAWGVTAFEASVHEDLAHRLAREEPDVGDVGDGDGIGDAFDTDGEPIDDQVGGARSGRIDGALLARHTVPPERHPAILVCGSTPFVEAVTRELVALGHPAGGIKTERYGGMGGTP